MRGAAGTIAVGALVALVLANSTDAAAQQGRAMAMLAQDPACTTPKVASAGGPMPKGCNTVVLRWLGVSNYELSYRDQVILFDTFYSRVWPDVRSGSCRRSSRARTPCSSVTVTGITSQTRPTSRNRRAQRCTADHRRPSGSRCRACPEPTGDVEGR